MTLPEPKKGKKGMHFRDDLSVTIIDVIEFERKKGNYKTLKRDFYALSIRINTSTVFSYKYGKVQMNKSDICLMPKDIEYNSYTDGEKMIVVHFYMNNFTTDEIQAHTPEFPEEFHKLFEEILKVWQEKKPGYVLRATSIFYLILSMIKEEKNDDYFPQNRYLAAAEYIKNNFSDRELTIEKVSKHFNVCDALFRREFKKQLGMTPKKYLDDIRVDYSMHLLQSGYFTNDEVAERCGFGSGKYFRHVFKKKVGVCVSKYKCGKKEAKDEIL